MALEPSDRRLADAVDNFVAAIGPALTRLKSDIESHNDVDLDDVQPLRDAVEIVRSLIEVDGLYTDEELESFIEHFRDRIADPWLASQTPVSLRTSGVLHRARTWLDAPSPLFGLLVTLDSREGSHFAWRYHDLALELAEAVIALDGYRSPAEATAVDRWRGTLVGQLQAAGLTRRHPTPAHRVGDPPAARTADPDLTELLAELEAMIGLEPVKRQVRQVTNLLNVQRLRSQRGMARPRSSHHLVFTGNPGTGKTTVARLLASIYQALGVVSSGHLVETDRAGLVAGYVGQTAKRVDAVVEEARGGVLLIDEAYSLVRGGPSDFGQEALDALVKRMEDHRGDLVVIVAGYPEEMDDFLDANPGLRSRFPTVIHFPDYHDTELVAIFEHCCRIDDYDPTPGALEAVGRGLAGVERGRGFGNGRLARTMFERATLAHAARIVGISDPSDTDLRSLTAADVEGHLPD